MSSSSVWWPRAKLTHYLSPRFPPVFSRGDNCPYFATRWLPSTCVRELLTLKNVGQSFFSVLSQLAMGAMHGTHGTQISPLNELVILLMAKGETDPLPKSAEVGAKW